MNVQLRRYEIAPGAMTPFIEWWERGIVPLRKKFGFRVLFAFVNDEASEFTWAVAHDGDFKQMESAYNASPEREKVIDGIPRWVNAQHVAMVTVQVSP
jgi:hypothetical protein